MNRLTGDYRPLGRSLINGRNTSGPRTIPCGTSEVTSVATECSHWCYELALTGLGLSKSMLDVSQDSLCFEVRYDCAVHEVLQGFTYYRYQ